MEQASTALPRTGMDLLISLTYLTSFFEPRGIIRSMCLASSFSKSFSSSRSLSKDIVSAGMCLDMASWQSLWKRVFVCEASEPHLRRRPLPELIANEHI